MVVKHKFRAKRTESDGIKFDSKKEALRYNQLKLLQSSGDVVFFLRQTPFHLSGNVKYVCDFLVFYKDGTVEVEDVKGHRTDVYIMKKKMVEHLYPIEIREL